MEMNEQEKQAAQLVSCGCGVVALAVIGVHGVIVVQFLRFAWADIKSGEIAWWIATLLFMGPFIWTMSQTSRARVWRSYNLRKWYLGIPTTMFLLCCTLLCEPLALTYVAGKSHWIAWVIFVTNAAIFLGLQLQLFLPNGGNAMDRVFGSGELNKLEKKEMESGLLHPDEWAHVLLVRRLDTGVSRLAKCISSFWVVCFVGVELLGLSIFTQGHGLWEWGQFVLDSLVKGLFLDIFEIYEWNVYDGIVPVNNVDKAMIVIFRVCVTTLSIAVLGVLFNVKRLSKSEEEELRS